MQKIVRYIWFFCLMCVFVSPVHPSDTKIYKNARLRKKTAAKDSTKKDVTRSVHGVSADYDDTQSTPISKDTLAPDIQDVDSLLLDENVQMSPQSDLESIPHAEMVDPALATSSAVMTPIDTPPALTDRGDDDILFVQPDNFNKAVEDAQEALATYAVPSKHAYSKTNAPEMYNDYDDDEDASTTSADEYPVREELIELQFENADLQNLVKQIEDIFEVTFLTDDIIESTTPIKGAKSIKGNKITFKTNTPLTREKTWNLFIAFLHIAGFTVVETALPRIYRISNATESETSKEPSRKLAFPSYIGVDYTTLPDNDEIIRYVYFIENSTLDSIGKMVNALKSSNGSLILLPEHKAFILTDRSYNIKVLMEIVKGIDAIATPQSVSVLLLRRADAKKVKELYDSIIQTDDKTANNKLFARRQPTSIFFPENMRIIAEPRRNALILLGPTDAIAKVEKFIKEHFDKELDQPYSPLYTYQLKYADAITIAQIMNDITKFGKDTDAGKSGGVRGVDKYMQPMLFVPEKESNRLIIKGLYDDYIKAVEIIKQLDEPQPQIAIEILLLSVNLQQNKSLGSQLRSKNSATGLLGNNIKWQTSGNFAGGAASSVVQNISTDETTSPGVERLLGNILQIVTGAGPGNTIVQLGHDLLSVWGIFQVLQSITNAQVLSNPFLIATNKTPSLVSLGEERRVVSSQVVGLTTTAGFDADDAKLEVEVTPQINSDGMIVLKLKITYDQFINTTVFTDAQKNLRTLETITTLADREVLALGGLIKNSIVDSQNQWPIVGNIPVLGWLFKNKQKIQQKENLLILISARIIDPNETVIAQQFTQDRINDFEGSVNEMELINTTRDPIHRTFFNSTNNSTENITQNLLFERHNTNVIQKRKRGLISTPLTPETIVPDVDIGHASHEHAHHDTSSSSLVTANDSRSAMSDRNRNTRRRAKNKLLSHNIDHPTQRKVEL